MNTEIGKTSKPAGLLARYPSAIWSLDAEPIQNSAHGSKNDWQTAKCLTGMLVFLALVGWTTYRDKFRDACEARAGGTYIEHRGNRFCAKDNKIIGWAIYENAKKQKAGR